MAPYTFEAHDSVFGHRRGLMGENIPLIGRIVAIADSYDAIAVTRPYHKARQHLAIMDILQREAGIKHDPALFQAFSVMIETSALRAPLA